MPGENDLAVLLRTLRPVLDAEQFVYAVVGEPPAGLTPFALVREAEATTIVVSRAEAERHGLGDAVVSVCRRITLDVHSSLEAVGSVALRPTQGMLKTQPRLGSDGHGQLVERNRHTPIRRLRNGQLVVSASNVLDERMPGDDDPGATVLL